MQNILWERARHLVLIMVLFVCAYFFYLLREIAYSVMAGAVFAFICFRPVKYLESKGINRSLAIVIIYLFLVGMICLGFYAAIPVLQNELKDFGAAIPEYANQLQNWSQKLEKLAASKHWEEIVSSNITNIEASLVQHIQSFIQSLINIFSRLIIIVFAPILAFYIMRDWEMIRAVFMKLFSPVMQRKVENLMGIIDRILIDYVQGYLVLSLLIGVLTGLVAALLGVKYPLLIGIIIAIGELFPYFGIILSSIPIIALALSESLELGLYMGLAILIIQQLESNVISPKIMGDRLGLNSLVIVLALLAGGELFGIWGLIIAVPTTAILKVLIAMSWQKWLAINSVTSKTLT